MNENKEKVLNFLLNICNKQNDSFIGDTESIYNEFKQMSLFEDVLRCLDNDYLIKTHWADGGVIAIEVLPDGFTYFENKKAAKVEYWKQLALSKFSDVLVSAITSIIMYFVMKWIVG